MSVNKVIAAIDPRNMHDAVMNKMDQVAVQKRSVAGKIFIKAPALVGLSATAIVTNVAAAVTDAFILLGKLPLAALKYGVMKPIQVITFSNAFESIQAKMPNGKSLFETTKKVAAKAIGILYSVTGLALPKFNLRVQEELGNFANKRKAAEAQKVVETAKAAEAQKATEAQQAEADRVARERADKARADAEANARKELDAAEDLKKAQAESKKKGQVAANDAAFVAGTHFPIFKNAKEAQRALGRVAAEEAAEFVRARERAKDFAYLEQFAVAHKAMDGQPVRKAGFVVNGEAYTNKLFAKEDERRAVRLADIAELEKFAVAEELIQSNSKKEAPKMRSLPDEKSEDALVNAQRQQNELDQDLETLGAYQFDTADIQNTSLAPQQHKPISQRQAEVAAAAPAAAATAAAPYKGGMINPLNWNLNPMNLFRSNNAVAVK